jgi:soluble lytic murein transglycosylase-like protein
MGALGLLAALALAADPIAQWQPLIAEASQRCGVPTAWIARVMRAESGGRTMLGGVPIRSPKGAIGLMQLMPGTWADLRADLRLGTNPDAPRDNIVAGACYLRRMYDRFGYPGLFAAYNAGPARYAAVLAGRSRLPGETIAYLATVGGVSQVPAQPTAAAPPPSLFVVRRDATPAPNAVPERQPQPGLFVISKAEPLP